MTTTLEKAARAAAKADATLHNGPDLYEANPELYLRLTRAVLMAVLPELARYQISYHPEYALEVDDRGDFVRYDDLQAILNEGEG